MRSGVPSSRITRAEPSIWIASRSNGFLSQQISSFCPSSAPASMAPRSWYGTSSLFSSADMDAAAGAVEEVARVIARIRARWPRTRILLRADSGFAREDLMAWCEGNGVDFLFGLARNERLVAEIATELDLVAAKSRRSGRPERRFKTFMWTTRRTWSRRRRVVAKAEWTKGEANPRFVVTSLRRDECKAKYLYEKVYCARGEMENRIKECQL